MAEIGRWWLGDSFVPEQHGPTYGGSKDLGICDADCLLDARAPSLEHPEDKAFVARPPDYFPITYQDFYLERYCSVELAQVRNKPSVAYFI